MLTKAGITLGGLSGQAWRQLSPDQIAQRCLAEAGNDPDRATRLVGRYAHGARQRATVAAIGSALLRASTAAKGGVS
jgi:hypothetical protein